jgi:hypothetical protein
MIDFQRGLRIVGALVMALAVAHCGDGGGGNDNGSDGGSPAPGTFTGTLEDGGSIRIEVGSIDEIAFDCDGTPIQETFSPPRPINTDGSFAIDFTDGGRRFEVRGTFTDENHLDGEINDQENECDSDFEAARGALPRTPTPVVTPTGGVTLPPTETPGATFTPNGSDSPTASPTNVITDGTITKTPTPTPTSTSSPDGCPVAIAVIGTAGTAKVLDTGWTGLAHDQTVIQDGKLTLTVSGCDQSCTNCTIGNPVQNVNADNGDINPHRCSNDTSIKCENDAGCTAPGKCVFFFGAPLPLNAGGVSTCVTNQINGNVTGTANLDTGQFATSLTLSSRVFNAIETALPCPACVGDATVNDGMKGGTCSGGSKNGQMCDGNGRSAVPSFGTTSLDCPPNPGAVITTLSIALDGSSGTETLTLTATSPPCSGFAGRKCFCAADGQTTRPNACIDATDMAGDGTLCAMDSPTTGHCTEGPTDRNCAIETFRGCLNNSECPAPGDTCTAGPRVCYLDNGLVGGSVSAFGMADPPDANGAADPTFAALFCVGKTNAAVNAAAGLPGLGRIELPLHTQLLDSPAP